MLVLTRKQGDRICIGDRIEVTVVAIRGNRVKLAFSAPEEVSIKRHEIVAGEGYLSAVRPPAVASPYPVNHGGTPDHPRSFSASIEARPVEPS